jgi:hypothetical protein
LSLLVFLAGVGSFRFAFGHFDTANASSLVRPDVDPATVGTIQETLTNADRVQVAYIFPAIDAKPVPDNPAPDLSLPLSPPAAVTPRITSRHWHEPAAGVTRQAKEQKSKRKSAKNDAVTIKFQATAESNPCQLESFDAVRWAFNVPTGCHSSR